MILYILLSCASTQAMLHRAVAKRLMILTQTTSAKAARPVVSLRSFCARATQEHCAKMHQERLEKVQKWEHKKKEQYELRKWREVQYLAWYINRGKVHLVYDYLKNKTMSMTSQEAMNELMDLKAEIQHRAHNFTYEKHLHLCELEALLVHLLRQLGRKEIKSNHHEFMLDFLMKTQLESRSLEQTVRSQLDELKTKKSEQNSGREIQSSSSDDLVTTLMLLNVYQSSLDHDAIGTTDHDTSHSNEDSDTAGSDSGSESDVSSD